MYPRLAREISCHQLKRFALVTRIFLFGFCRFGHRISAVNRGFADARTIFFGRLDNRDRGFVIEFHLHFLRH